MNVMRVWAVQHFQASLYCIRETTVNPNHSSRFLLGPSGKGSALCYRWGEGKLEY